MSTESDPPHTPLTPGQADALLELLIHDPHYRELFCHDLPAALARIGYTAGTDALMCLRPVRLASPEELAAARDSLRQTLTVGDASRAAMFIPFRLEAGPGGPPPGHGKPRR